MKKTRRAAHAARLWSGQCSTCRFHELTVLSWPDCAQELAALATMFHARVDTRGAPRTTSFEKAPASLVHEKVGDGRVGASHSPVSPCGLLTATRSARRSLSHQL